MTLHELNAHRDIILLAKNGRIVISDLRARANPASPNMDGMPHASGVSDKVGELAMLLMEAEQEQEQREERADKSKNAVRAFTNTIEDPFIRHVFNLRFIDCEDWASVAGIGSTADAVKRICYRYLAEMKRDQD